eukprot:TRINITY_DN23296_c0_g1_i1.p1 TRINITY_DN23296_c0_g1~~TRINITY_DN23296_c0_g1_i1.p1  ORF type:complete len:2172 (+),score=409.66 TRINITY_DN23296_c0_g1_i1:128-6643(+)
MSADAQCIAALDGLDLDAFEARSLKWSAVEHLMQDALALEEPALSLSSLPESQALSASARLAQLLAAASTSCASRGARHEGTTLTERWTDDVLDRLRTDDDEATHQSYDVSADVQEIECCRDLLASAVQRLQACQQRKEDATLELVAALTEREAEEDDDVGEDDASPQAAGSAVGGQEKKRKGWGKMKHSLKKKLGGGSSRKSSRDGDLSASTSDVPRGLHGANGAGDASPSPAEARATEANAKLVQAAEAVQLAQENYDVVQRRNRAALASLQTAFPRGEAMHGRRCRGAVSLAAHALEDWARCVGISGCGDAVTSPCFDEGLSGASTCDSSGATSDQEAPAIARPPPSLSAAAVAVRACAARTYAAAEDSERHALQIGRENQELLQAFFSTRPALVFKAEAARLEGHEHSSASEERCVSELLDSVACLSMENERLQKALAHRRPRHFGRCFRRKVSVLDGEVDHLERAAQTARALNVAAAAAAAAAEAKPGKSCHGEVVAAATAIASVSTSVGLAAGNDDCKRATETTGALIFAADAAPAAKIDGGEARDSEAGLQLGVSQSQSVVTAVSDVEVPKMAAAGPLSLSVSVEDIESLDADGCDGHSDGHYVPVCASPTFGVGGESSRGANPFGKSRSPSSESEASSSRPPTGSQEACGQAVDVNPFSACSDGSSDGEQENVGNPFGLDTGNDSDSGGEVDAPAANISALRTNACSKNDSEVSSAPNPFEACVGSSAASDETGGINPFDASAQSGEVRDANPFAPSEGSIVESSEEAELDTSHHDIQKDPELEKNPFSMGSDEEELEFGDARMKELRLAGAVQHEQLNPFDVDEPDVVRSEDFNPFGFDASLEDVSSEVQRRTPGGNSARSSRSGSRQKVRFVMDEDDAPSPARSEGSKVLTANPFEDSGFESVTDSRTGVSEDANANADAVEARSREDSVASASSTQAVPVRSKAVVAASGSVALDLELALARSDAALCKGRTGQDDGYWSWTWRDFAAEEWHGELQRCSGGLVTALSDDDWTLFAYELLLLAHANLSQDAVADSALEHVRAALPICRVRLGITSGVHHRLAQLTLPDNSQSYSPLDVRHRACVLLRSWACSEAPALGGANGDAGGRPEWTAAWIRRQLAILRSSVLATCAFHGEPVAEEGEASAAGVCLQILRRLQAIAAEGRWGQPLATDDHAGTSGRRLLTLLLHGLDAILATRGKTFWRLDTVSAAKACSKLWAAATDADAEDCLSPDAPTVAAALLSGVHPSVGTAPLRLETHSLLFAQQLWVAMSEGLLGASPVSAAGAARYLKTEALRMASSIMDDLTLWLQNTSTLSAASCFARRASVVSEVRAEEALELTARRLLSVELRDGLAVALTDYRRHFEPPAFCAAVDLWWLAQLATARPKVLIEADMEGSLEPVGDRGHASSDAELFLHRMGHWLVWRSATSTGELVLADFMSPPVVAAGDADAWKRSGPRIKRHIDAFSKALTSLLEEHECEERLYSEAWARRGLRADHSGIAAVALCEAARPCVEALLESGAWPSGEDGGIAELPAGAGPLLQALEALDRLAVRFPPSKSPPSTSAGNLVELLVPHATFALASSFSVLDRDVTSRALDGTDTQVYQPLKPPKLLHCAGVVTLWRFVHDALDAPLNCGVPVDLVVGPFFSFLGGLVPGLLSRLARPYEQSTAFRLRARAALVTKALADDSIALDESGGESQASGPEEDDAVAKRRRSRRMFSRRSSSEAALAAEPTCNKVSDAALLDVEPRVVAAPLQQVSVRLSSLGFCMEQLGAIHGQLLRTVNSGDDAAFPTRRHNDARRLICEQCPELQESMHETGGFLARYVAARLIYFELRKDLFEDLYFEVDIANAEDGPESEGRSLHGCVTLDVIIRRRRESLMGMVSRTPPPFLLAFVVELGTQLACAWSYVVVDYLRRQKLDQLVPHLEEDQVALQHLLSSLMQEARRLGSIAVASGANAASACGAGGAGAATSAPGLMVEGLSREDFDDGQRRLEEVQKGAQMLVLKAHSGTAEELARYAARVCGDMLAASAVDRRGSSSERTRERSQTPPLGVGGDGGRRSASSGGRSKSPVVAAMAAAVRSHGASSAPPRGRSASPSPAAAAAGLLSPRAQRAAATPSSRRDGDARGDEGRSKSRSGAAKLWRSASKKFLGGSTSSSKSKA